MPLYHFQCERCGREFEVFLRLSEVQDARVCPGCGSSKMKEGETATSALESCSLDKKT